MEPSRILIVDDSLTIRRALEFILKPKGYALEFAGDGKEAVEAACRFQPDLVLLDYVLPDMRGPEVCKALEGHPETASTPIVLVSAKGASIRQTYQDATNVVSYITKPFKPAVVQAVVENALGRPKATPTPARAVVPLHSEPAATPPAAPIVQREPAALPIGVDATFTTLLRHLEEALTVGELAEGRTASPGLEAIAEPLRRSARALGRLEEHLSHDAIRAYRFRGDGSVASLAETLFSAHRSLCDVAAALTTCGAPSPETPERPTVVAMIPKDHPRSEEVALAVAEATANSGLVVQTDFAAAPFLVKLLAPQALVSVPGASPELDGSLQRAIESAPSSVTFVALTEADAPLGPEWDRFAARIPAGTPMGPMLRELQHKAMPEESTPEVHLEVVAV